VGGIPAWSWKEKIKLKRYTTLVNLLFAASIGFCIGNMVGQRYMAKKAIQIIDQAFPERK